MPDTFSVGYSPNYKPTFAQHREWAIGVIGNGDSWPRIIPDTFSSSSDFERLGIIPTFVLTAPSTTSGASTPGTYGVCLVYRSSKYNNNLTNENIQSNRSNIVDVDLTAGSLAVVLTRVTTTDTKVDNLDIYAAQKISGTYGAFYRVVKSAANSAGTVTFDIIQSNGYLIGSSVTNGTASTDALVLADNNDYPQAQPILIEMNGRLVALGGLTKSLTCTFVNGASTITTTETIYDGIEFWNFHRPSDTTGGINSRGTYYVRYHDANTLDIVNADGTSATYSGGDGAEVSQCWTEANRKYSQALNPHAFPIENINNDYPSAILAGGKVPNTNRLLIMGKNWVIAEDYDRLPIQSGLNYISTEYGCSSHFTIVGAHGRLYWLDFGYGKREVCFSDGSTVQPISTKKIKTILKQLTLDQNGDPWRITFIHGVYLRNEDTIRWGIYLNNNTVPNIVLELDLTSEDLRNDPTWYVHRYLDVFTYGDIRGNTFVGQYGDGTTARIGIDNIPDRYIDWVPSGTVSGNLDTSGQTTVTFTDSNAVFLTDSGALAGIQALIWHDNTDGTDDTIIKSPTYYHCRIASNTATTFTVNYVESCNSIGEVQSVDVALPSVPSGSGWKYVIGDIQAIMGPKWMTSQDAKSRVTLRELSMNHRAYSTQTTQRLRCHFHENMDNTPSNASYAEAVQEGVQTSDDTLSGHSRAIASMNPSTTAGFTIVDNNGSFSTLGLNIETITLDYNDDTTQDDQAK